MRLGKMLAFSYRKSWKKETDNTENKSKQEPQKTNKQTKKPEFLFGISLYFSIAINHRAEPWFKKYWEGGLQENITLNCNWGWGRVTVIPKKGVGA